MADTKREDIIEATKSLLWQHGYESMSPRMVLDASGAGQGSLYHHFKGKKGLAIAALDEIEAEMRDSATAILTGPEPALERIHYYLTQKRDGTKGCRLGRLATERSITDEELRAPVARYFKHVEALLATVLEEAMREGALRTDVPPARLATTLVAVVQGGFLLSRIHASGRPMKEATAGAAAMLTALET